ncbi:hypothetical protein [Phytoactinopolyspora mesophila]|uniref:Terminase n=1 Tax=Phytoactinopolyspora mesophila TaxID=2650750 RepID=A0A7K3M894_9ACTN|nr:hypothetical protein [Phytoactinopolyspora mesophila]NDL58628.1 hypothetical protein [Phytoactinopolyspora mesophila]
MPTPQLSPQDRNVFALAADLFRPKPENKFVNDPVGFIETELGEHLWSKQKEICESIVSNRKTAVRSCHDSGKSYIASRIVSWWIAVHEPGEAFVVTTAPTHAQVESILWREIGKAHKSGKMIGNIVRSPYPKWYVDGELVGFGRKPSDYDDSSFQGIHARHVLVVVDESSGISKNLWTGVESLLTNADARVLAIGNPDVPSCEFENFFKNRSGWNSIHIDGLKTPNIDKRSMAQALDDVEYGVDEENQAEVEQRELLLSQCPDSREYVPDNIRHLLLSADWVADKVRSWQVDSPLFISKVRGNFADSSENSVIPLSWIRAAQARWRERNKPVEELSALGLDVSGEGADETVAAYKHGARIDRLEVISGDEMAVANHVSAVAPSATIVVDAIGIGGGVASRLRELGRDARAFVASRASHARDRSGAMGFSNQRAEMWWSAREALDPSHGSTIEMPDDDELVAELVAPKWKVLAGGKIQVESKDEIRKRLGRSTDRADAVLQAMFTESSGQRMVVRSPVSAGHDGRGETTAVGKRLSAPMPKIRDRKPSWQRHQSR